MANTPAEREGRQFTAQSPFPFEISIGTREKGVVDIILQGRSVAAFETQEPFFPRTVNPYDPSDTLFPIVAGHVTITLISLQDGRIRANLEGNLSSISYTIGQDMVPSAWINAPQVESGFGGGLVTPDGRGDFDKASQELFEYIASHQDHPIQPSARPTTSWKLV